jgi:hypothetical protein
LFVETIMKSLTPEFFDTLIVVVVILGMALAVVRLYADFTRRLPPTPAPAMPPTLDMIDPLDETQPVKVIRPEDEDK